MNFGISAVDFEKSMKSFGEKLKQAVELYLNPQETEELNNPKTKKRRKKQLIKISEKRMIAEYYVKNRRWNNEY